MLEIKRYSKEFETVWNEIIAQASNRHFMIHRNYMDYHADRFEDASFLVLDEDKLVGVIPGNVRDKIWYSHQGLSFGGLYLLPKYNPQGLRLSLYPGRPVSEPSNLPGKYQDLRDYLLEPHPGRAVLEQFGVYRFQ